MDDEYLLKKTRVSITDERTFVGQLICYDAEGNVILNDVQESRPGVDGHRYLAMCMIPYPAIVTLEQVETVMTIGA